MKQCSWRIAADGAGHKLFSLVSVSPHTAPALGLSTIPLTWKIVQSQTGCSDPSDRLQKTLLWKVHPSAELL